MTTLLDLFCCQGGAGEGYRRAGFEVTGVDVEPQPLNPGKVIVADALEYLAEHGHEYDAIHASPPCQRYTTGGRVNVPGAPMRTDLLLCGSMFGLPTKRHRLFEMSIAAPCFGLMCSCREQQNVGVYGNLHGKRGAWPGMLPSTLETWREAIGADWMDAKGLSQAIPPAYTLHIGEALAAQVSS